MTLADRYVTWQYPRGSGQKPGTLRRGWARMNMQTAINQFLDKGCRHHSENYREALQIDLNLLMRSVRGQDARLTAFTEALVDQFMEDTDERGVQEGTKRRRVASIKKFALYLMAKGLIQVNPTLN